MMVRNIVAALVIAMLLPMAAYANCGSCKSKCNTCVKSSCNKCESKCSPCKKSCCEKKSCDSCNKCSPCKSKCNSCNKCAKPSCNKCESKCGGGCKTSCKKSCCEKKSCNSCNKCKPKCETGCKKSCCEKKSCNSCNKCAKPACEKPKCDPCKTVCACTDWKPYCGCEMIDSLCIVMTTCDCEGGTAGPMMLELHGNDGKTIATVQLDGPIDGSASWNYKFAEPIKADSLREAVLINNTDDSATVTSFSVTGMGECGWSYNYFWKKCNGIVIGKDGCPRFVLF